MINALLPIVEHVALVVAEYFGRRTLIRLFFPDVLVCLHTHTHACTHGRLFSHLYSTRKQFININTSLSKFENITSGVIHRLCLVLIIFLLYVNDLPIQFPKCPHFPLINLYYFTYLLITLNWH